MKLTKQQKEDFKQYIGDKLGFPKKEVKIKSHLVYDLCIDSLDFVEIIMDSEVKHNISIDDFEAEKHLTVGAFIRLIEKSPRK